jgi:hypothetical protein
MPNLREVGGALTLWRRLEVAPPGRDDRSSGRGLGFRLFEL